MNKLDSTNVFSTFQHINNKVLEQAQHQSIFRYPAWCGIDIHKNPYYGRTWHIHILGMENVRGPNFGHGYASIECMNTRERFTLAALPLTQFTTEQ